MFTNIVNKINANTPSTLVTILGENLILSSSLNAVNLKYLSSFIGIKTDKNKKMQQITKAPNKAKGIFSDKLKK